MSELSFIFFLSPLASTLGGSRAPFRTSPAALSMSLSWLLPCSPSAPIAEWYADIRLCSNCGRTSLMLAVDLPWIKEGSF